MSIRLSLNDWMTGRHLSRYDRLTMRTPTILLDFQLRSAWDRGVAQGIIELGRERPWNLILCTPNTPLSATADTWEAAVIVSADPQPIDMKAISNRLMIAVGHDHSASGIPSIEDDHNATAALAAQHFLNSGLKNTSIFAYSSESEFARGRAQGFHRAIEAGGGVCHPGGEFSNDSSAPNFCSHQAIIAWLEGLPKPCGIFALCDDWASPVAMYCRHLGLRVPEDVALVGVDNDPLVCELSSPPLSSVAIPWREMGRLVVKMIEDHFNGRPVPAVCTRVQPLDVVIRRSSDIMSIKDTQLAEAVQWIRQNAHRAIGVEDILRAIPTYRQRLERQFRTGLGRTVMEEVRRAHVELAKTLLRTTELPMPDVAGRCGFTNATLLGVNFRKEVGITPSEYRRRSRDETMTARPQSS